MLAHPLALPLLAGIGLRVAWVLSGHFEAVSEASFYHQHAVDLAAGRGYLNPETGTPTAFLPPGYSMLLAPWYWLLGPSTQVAGVVNALLGGLGIVGAFALARQIGGTTTGRMAAWILAVFPSQVLYTSALNADHLVAALLPWLLWLATRVSSRSRAPTAWPLATGVLIGIGTLAAAPILLLLPALACGWWALAAPRETVRRALITTAAAALVLMPWTVRNAIQLHAFVPVSTNGGVNLWIGNNDRSGPGWMPWTEGQSWRYPGDEVAADREYRTAGVRYMLAHPSATLRHWPGKLRHTFMQDYNYVEHFSLAPRDQAMPPMLNGRALHWLADRYYFAVIILALAGLGLHWRREARRLLVPVGVALVAPSMLFFGLDRFHVAMLPILAALSGASLHAAAGLAGQHLSQLRVPTLRVRRGPAATGQDLGAAQRLSTSD